MMLNKLSLNTIGLNRIGLNRIGKPSRGSSDRPYIDPEVLASLKAVCICYGKSNDDPDRAIVKNLVDPDNPFIISNAAYKLNSGYGLYEDFSVYKSPNANVVITDTKIKAVGKLTVVWVASAQASINQYKVKITGIPNGGHIGYAYRLGGVGEDFYIYKDGIYNIPASDADDGITGYILNNLDNDWSKLTIEQIPSYQGAFVTDGVDDLITSTKTVQEMGITDEITVVSMIHQIKESAYNNRAYTNYINGNNGHFRNQVADTKTGIYGYTITGLNSTNASGSVVNNILGDKNDYEYDANTSVELGNAKYSVQNYIKSDGTASNLGSQVAWYWTIIANKVLTTDQINQVIAYYNLDRCVEPTVLYDVKRQGLSNDTPDSDWYLKDFSKNGFDMSLFNFAKKGNSGVGRYSADFESFDWTVGISQKQHNKATISLNGRLCNHAAIEVDEMKVNIIGNVTELIYWYIANPDDTARSEIRLTSGINTLPKSYAKDDGQIYNIGFAYISGDSEITITQIPSHAGALCSDGVNDFGKVTGLPIYKDYTVVADRELFNVAGCVLSNDNPGAFIFETSSASAYSFGEATSSLTIPTDKQIRYQTKYSYNGQNISIGAVKEGTSNMWLGTIRDNDAIFRSAAIYSLMTFPYSMSEFLIERQLKKHKLGTLYPDMVEFRPIVNSNVKYQDIIFRNTSTGEDLVAGQYYDLGTISIFIKPLGCDEATAVKVNNVNAEFNSYDESSGYYRFDSVVTKSPQKIDITIDEYIRYEDIVQPYPMFFEFYNENNELFTWGGKVKVGSTITRTKGVAYSNLLEDLYTITNPRLNGVQLAGDEHTVEKQMVFTCDATYIKGSNAPKCILSPSRLRIPNSSYKILGYIPDISGHGNHGKINNSAYALNSGANGYTELEFSKWRYNASEKRAEFTITNDTKLNITKVLVQNWAIIYTVIGDYTSNKIQRYKVTGVNKNQPIVFGNDNPTDALLTITSDGEYEVDWKTYGKNPCIFTNWTGDCNITIEQVGEYEGAYCLDGVDDFITIPTLSSGGKQVLMKVNWQSSIGQGMLYDQGGTAFAIWNSDKYNDDETDTIPAYSARNGGNTYIDGILNKNILASQLRNITHNIVATNTMLNGSSVSPTIGCRTEHDAYFTNMSLYDFMLFDEISTDEEILTLNKYIGIEGNVWGTLTELSNSTLISNETLIKNE